jgi:hypothetical protein
MMAHSPPRTRQHTIPSLMLKIATREKDAMSVITYAKWIE